MPQIIFLKYFKSFLICQNNQKIIIFEAFLNLIGTIVLQPMPQLNIVSSHPSLNLRINPKVLHLKPC
jgi:hypothetical protein